MNPCASLSLLSLAAALVKDYVLPAPLRSHILYKRSRHTTELPTLMNPKLIAAAVATIVIAGSAGAFVVPRLLLGGGPDETHAIFMPRPGARPAPPTQAEPMPQAAAPPSQAQANATQRLSPDELDKAQTDALGQFTSENGTMYGAAQVCSPQAAEGVLACSNLIMTKWQTLTRLPPPKDPNLQQSLSQNWTRASEAARRAQSGQNPPATCERVVEMVRRSPIWRICDRIQAFSPLDGAPPAQQPLR